MRKSLTIPNAVIKSARADMVKANLDITISVTVTEELLAMRKELAFLAWDEANVTVVITDNSQQPELLGLQDPVHELHTEEEPRV